MMKTRREFLGSAALFGVLGAMPGPLGAAENMAEGGATDRRYWVSVAERLGRPVLGNLARRELKLKMPVEEKPGSNRRASTHLVGEPWTSQKLCSGENLQADHAIPDRQQVDLSSLKRERKDSR